MDTTTIASAGLAARNTIDCTPPANLPDLVIIVDHSCKAAPYSLRIAIPNGCNTHILADADGNAQTLLTAVQSSIREGYEPTQYVEVYENGRVAGPWIIPSSIPRRPASPAQTKSLSAASH